MKKNKLITTLLSLVGLVAGCFLVGKTLNMFGSTDQPNVIPQDTQVPSATPEQVTFDNVCDHNAELAELQGYLRLPDSPSCTRGGGQDTCYLRLFDPYSGRELGIEMPVSEQADPAPNQMAQMPSTFSNSDLKIRSADGVLIGYGDPLQVRGLVDSKYPGAESCNLTGITYVQSLQKLTPPAGMSLTNLSLAEAVANGFVLLEISGDGLTNIQVKLKPQVDFNLEVSIEAGTLFESLTSGVQNMVVRHSMIVVVKPQIEVSFELEVSCANMALKQPGGSDNFVIGSLSVSPDVIKLLSQPDFKFQSMRIQQFAIWTITDNPVRNGYVAIDSSHASGGPSDEEIQLIKDLFIQAGIDLLTYLALQ